MSRVPDYAHILSLKMSQVMDRICVSEKIVMKRRISGLLRESLFAFNQELRDNDVNVFFFGSQIEGTTTLGLQPDVDCIISINNCNVIQDLSAWQNGKVNLLMIQNENVSPGYCLLQALRGDAPLPQVVEVDDNFYRDRMGRLLLKNTMFDGLHGAVRNGPAQSFSSSVPGLEDGDFVAALPCHLRPVQARHRFNQHREEHWPTSGMIQYCSNTRCFVVGVRKTGSANEEFEWRISTSFAERFLMFTLNITQIRCYVLMKMILKTFIKQRFPNSISSFMCKTVLLHCISDTRSDAWKENTLFTCLSFCLLRLYNCVQNEYCPHFFITQNNLMSGRFTPETKPLILKNLRYVIESNRRALLGIECDYFGSFLQSSLNGIEIYIPTHYMPTFIAWGILKISALAISIEVKVLLRDVNNLSPRLAMQKLLKFISNHYFQNFIFENRKAYRLLSRYLFSTLGSILASLNINQQDNLAFKKALSCMSLGLDTDVASGKLKLASMFYCTGDNVRTELILKNIEECYDLSAVEPMCGCYYFKYAQPREKFYRLCYESIKECALLKDITASCVCFIQCEINCCPLELQHEMFRSKQENIAYRNKYEYWMDMAVVDSLPYLYFMQYKTYSRLGRQDDKQKALSNIARTIDVEPNLGHRETALNLLGQCMEQENNPESAFKCYARSLQIRGRYNWAKIHICKLLNKLINN